ncbi:hypothetical protein J2X32_002130 [Rheinheimera pacifica]|uniref:hypothetical protein n=1 Tax=Rheinheimera pacifica TaxID=173990 RepID=UPI002865DE71|nr:hypothetical protein [Rheinheimera pacifica]MDR6983494.1 hypothetical protein [Rheinheimera pacifica]
MENIYNNSKMLASTLASMLFCFSFSAHPVNTVYPVIDLRPFGCPPSDEVACINTEYTQIVVDVIDDGTGTIQTFPYPRALNMFENGQSPILVALANKRLMEQANIIELYCAEFYLVSMETEAPLGRKTISYLRGADAQKEIASFIAATPFEVNDYHQIIMLLKANRLDYVIIPRYMYERDAGGIFSNAKVLSRHKLPIVLYVNKNASQHFERIKEALSKTSLPGSERYHYLFP